MDLNKKLGKKRNLFKLGRQLMNVEGMMEIENHCLATIIIIIDLGICWYGMFILVGEILMNGWKCT